jgi:hypothetical protein
MAHMMTLRERGLRPVSRSRIAAYAAAGCPECAPEQRARHVKRGRNLARFHKFLS